MWARNYVACVRCGKNDTRHVTRGLCNRCYRVEYARAHKERLVQYKHEWYVQFVQGTDRGKTRRERLYFSGLREAILVRDGSACVRCNSHNSLVVHHKDGQGRSVKHPNNTLENLETLCRSCHINEHRAELLKTKQQNGFHRSTLGRWSRYYDCCRRCHTTTIRHSGHGYCRTCRYHVKQKHADC